MSLVFSCPLAAQQQADVRPWSIDLTPYIGYRSPMSFRTETVEGVTPTVSVDGSRSLGAAFGVRYNDEDVIELRWTRQDTRLRITAPGVLPASQHVILDQVHLDCSHEYLIEEWPEKARPFVIGSVGWTRVSSTATSAGFTRFSFSIGGGLKVFPSRHFGFRLQAQWVPLWIQPEVRAFCSGGCIVNLSGQLASQGEVTISPVFRF